MHLFSQPEESLFHIIGTLSMYVNESFVGFIVVNKIIGVRNSHIFGWMSQTVSHRLDGDAWEKCGKWWEKSALLDCSYSHITSRDSFIKMPCASLIDSLRNDIKWSRCIFSSAGWVDSAWIISDKITSAKLVSLYMAYVEVDCSSCMIRSFASLAIYKINSLRLTQNLLNSK